jgi:hypothetical protein
MPTTEHADRACRGRRWRQPLAALLLLGWLPAAGGLFWHFEGRYLAGAADQLARFDPGQLPPAPATGEVTVLYLSDRSCPCGRGIEARMAQLQQRFGNGLRQFVADEGAPLRASAAVRLDPPAVAAWRAALPHWPAVAVWGADGALAYLGPLRGASNCVGSDDSLTAAIVRAVDGDVSPPVAVDVAGCFCAARAGIARVDSGSTVTGNRS